MRQNMSNFFVKLFFSFQLFALSAIHFSVIESRFKQFKSYSMYKLNKSRSVFCCENVGNGYNFVALNPLLFLNDVFIVVEGKSIMKSKWRHQYRGVQNNQGSNGSRLFTFCDLYLAGVM